MAAHGGEMSPEDFRLELQKVIGTGSAAGGTAMTVVRAPSRESDATKYGVTQRFPEYQKSAYIPAQKSTRGKVWILDATGKLEPVPIRTGLSDGRYTEITSSTLKEGDQVIMGVSSNSESASDQTKSPFTGQAQRPVGGLR